MNNEKIEAVREALPDEELLTQLAEEAAELTQAALKMRRAHTGVNPTPTTPQKAFDDLVEEVGDVVFCLQVLGFPVKCDDLQTNMDAKLDRWISRPGREG